MHAWTFLAKVGLKNENNSTLLELNGLFDMFTKKLIWYENCNDDCLLSIDWIE